MGTWVRSKYRPLLVVLIVSLMFALTACGAGGTGKGDGGNGAGESATFKIGTQGYAEVEILGEMVKALIEAHTPHKVEHVSNLGTALAGHEATVRGDLHMNTSFTGTLFLGLLGQELTDEWRDPDKVYQYVRDAMREKYNLHVFAPYGYNNTYAIAVPRKWAEEHGVTKISDLAPYAAEMTLAVDHSWKTYPGQGYKEFTELYGFEFKSVPEMDFGLMYRSIEKGEVDAICAYSTDGQLVAQDLLVLEDDKGFNPPYNGILIARQDMLDRYPEVKEVLSKLEGLIDTEQMQQLNKRVVVDQEMPAAVAQAFLKEKGLIE
ncbi:MAG: glycine/betaine ABC transporter substrate-binding protein [Thermoanaerobacteraceae bacterium]|uniref:ABC transporter substrate-binding protein n=1 Tax=Thermanaeromonas sp. C210 TaxID=2731925 RepID=UPI00155CAA1E|nr:glycine betaine ABC transporter substrate-binding protein [Thermanaeromonas sp. C210]MBE3580832.1 glycine/betaine ABC transporter substrate-binding protein [Thermoanaerobacteraceae bacterium]GFN22055.1 glycine/betaine ABC transporter substrate-binding protein [Thermanaeromonas sp. C210]